MKIYLIFFLAIVFSSSIIAQQNNYLAISTGLPSTMREEYSAAAVIAGYQISFTGVLPLFIKYEYTISPAASLGLHVSGEKFTMQARYPSYSLFSLEDDDRYTYSSISIQAFVKCHLLPGKRIDPYIGAGTGYNFTEIEHISSDSLQTQVFIFPIAEDVPPHFEFALTAGLGYYFLPNLGVFVEAGIERATIQAGICSRF